jgi:hypothetical protein
MVATMLYLEINQQKRLDKKMVLQEEAYKVIMELATTQGKSSK